jgi:hypothetical protein
MLVIDSAINQDNKSKRKWRCLCDCGKLINVSTGQLGGGKIRSCGCKKDASMLERRGMVPRHLVKPVGVVNRNTLLKTYIRSAARRGLSWLLTDGEAFTIFEADCHYCGRHPFRPVDRAVSEGSLFNGIDRKDNSIGYELSNVVPACAPCNYIKSTMPYDFFIQWVMGIAGHLAKTHVIVKDYAPGQGAYTLSSKQTPGSAREGVRAS